MDLTPRECDVVELVAKGLSNKAIAERLSISIRTVENHVSNALFKNYGRSRTDLMRMWLHKKKKKVAA